MLKGILCVLCLSLGAAAQAQSALMDAVVASAQQMVLNMAPMQGRFNAGDVANYDLSVSSFTGTMVISVKSVDSQGVWIDQNINLSIQQEDIQELIDPNTGKVKELLVNGKQQTPPDPNDTQIVSTTRETITVKAGTFNCIAVKVHEKTHNTDEEEWVAQEVPVMGLVQMKTTANGMPVSAELTSFKFANGN